MQPAGAIELERFAFPSQKSRPMNATTVDKTVQLTEDNWQHELAAACRKVQLGRGRVVLCITGRAGSGKSSLGKTIRKKGLPGIPPSRIAVVDDGVLSVPLLGIFNRRIRHKSSERDELAPFEPHLRSKSLLVYIASQPEKRLSRCDLLLNLRCSDDERLRRLRERNTDGDKRFMKTAQLPEISPIEAQSVFDLVTG
jgi:hypothetical protein